MSRFDDFHSVVREFMQDFGTIGTFIKYTQGDYIDGEQFYVQEDIDVECIRLDLTLASNGLGTKPNSLIQDGDVQMIVRPVDRSNPYTDILKINPATDKITVGSITYSIVTYKQYNPTGVEPIAYDIYLRR